MSFFFVLFQQLGYEKLISKHTAGMLRDGMSGLATQFKIHNLVVLPPPNSRTVS